MIEGSGSRAGSGSIPVTSGSGSGSRRPKNTWIRWIRIRIRNNGRNQGFSYFFLDDGRIRIRSWSERPKNLRILRIRTHNTGMYKKSLTDLLARLIVGGNEKKADTGLMCPRPMCPQPNAHRLTWENGWHTGRMTGRPPSTLRVLSTWWPPAPQPATPATADPVLNHHRPWLS